MLRSGLLGGEPQLGTVAAPPSPDAAGSGAVGAPRAVRVNSDASQSSASLEDRGVRGAFLRWGDMELPLDWSTAFELDGTTLSITVHEGIHPGCAHKGTATTFTCETAAEAAEWQCEMKQSIERADGRFWGTSRSMIEEQRDRWMEESRRCAGMTVAQYFEDIGIN